MEQLIDISKRRVKNTPVNFKRFLINKINISQRLIGIKGARGVGKTTLLLQILKTLPSEETLYVSLDNLYFVTNTLFDLANRFTQKGGSYLYLDEVHKYKNWSQELKNIYDSFPELKIIFTSSSALEINKGQFDLSRRALVFNLPGLSYREYLELKHNIKINKISLDYILNNTDEAVNNILDKIKPFEFFENYLKSGYYPYFIEDEEFYYQRLETTIKIVIETDLPAIYRMDYSSIIKLKKLLMLIGGVSPYIPNISKLSKQVETTRDSLLKFLHLLHKAHILRWLSSDTNGINFMNKPDKLYLDNTNIAYALKNDKVDIGTIRETFFLNQLSVDHMVSYPKKADFYIDNKYTFEIGGKNKSQKQIKDIDNSFIVKDNIEYGNDNIIPLWLFGFLY